MSICFLAPNFHPIIGGAETYLSTIVEGLTKKGVEVLVITNGKDVDAPYKENIRGTDVLRLTNYWGRLTDPTKVRWEEMYFSLLSEIKPIIDEYEVDIIHVNSLDTAILGAMVSLQFKVPLICSFHEHAPEMESFGEGKCELVFSHLPVDKFIAGSNFYFEKATMFGANTDRVQLIYHGIDLSKFNKLQSSTSRSKFGISDSSVVLLCTARLKERKGLLELIRSISIVKDLIPNIYLIIAGSRNSASDEYAESLYQEIRNLELDNFISIVEDLTLNEMPDLYSISDLVVQPSYEEGLGLSILEAMAMCKPVISTKVRGVKEIITHNDTGWLIEPKSIHAISDSILLLLKNNELRKRLACNGYNLVKNKFNLDIMIEELINTYNSVINKNKKFDINKNNERVLK